MHRKVQRTCHSFDHPIGWLRGAFPIVPQVRSADQFIHTVSSMLPFRVQAPNHLWAFGGATRTKKRTKTQTRPIKLPSAIGLPPPLGLVPGPWGPAGPADRRSNPIDPTTGRTGDSNSPCSSVCPHCLGQVFSPRRWVFHRMVTVCDSARSRTCCPDARCTFTKQT